MADTAQAILSFARDHVLPYIIEAANMIKGVPKDVEDMKNKLENIQAMIYDADRAVDLADRGTLPDDIKEKAYPVSQGTSSRL
ncbi:hypothetical protein RJT34_00020 [Clitoria ternatea]|uniref:Disease resistance N-terminal domain-containing protein n=1 Tax=Clitoria ternatea TaxID=43366 RepID=A0AAN9KHQ7_CLITE